MSLEGPYHEHEVLEKSVEGEGCWESLPRVQFLGEYQRIRQSPTLCLKCSTSRTVMDFAIREHMVKVPAIAARHY